jgi:hypothetical protein
MNLPGECGPTFVAVLAGYHKLGVRQLAAIADFQFG